MKPIKLEIEGLNSFEGKQELDFTKLGDGVFGIFGKTGSGKSTILDAITLALYGDVGRSKQNIDFINTKCKKATVSLEFEIYVSGRKKRYLVSRSFSIRKNGKDVESTASLYEIFSDGEKLVSEGATRVNEQIYLIVGLGQNEFSKCIALPQGEFSAFLKAKQSERTEIMSNIFDLSKYGENLCAKVKDKLAEFDKSVTGLESSLKLVEYANDLTFDEAKLNYETKSEEYEKTKKELAEKNRIYSLKTTSLEKRNKLSELKSKLAELENGRGKMNKLEEEIEKNLGANAVKVDFEKLQKAIADEKSLSEKIAELNESKLTAESELEVHDREFEEFKQTYSAKLVELTSKQSKLSDLVELEAEENSLIQDKQKVEKELEEVKVKIAKKQEDLEYLSSSIAKIDEEIEQIDEFIEANRPDVNLSYALEQTKGIESELILIDDTYKKLEKLVDQTNEDLASVQEEYNSSIAQEKEISDKREKIQSSIEVAFEDVDTTDFKKLRSCDSQIQDMREVQILVSKVDETIAKLELDIQNRMSVVSSIDAEITDTQNTLSGMELEITNKSANLSKTRDEREELLGDSFFALVSNQLKIGDTCPVCSSIVNQKNYYEVPDIKPITSAISSAEQEIKGLRIERDKVFGSLISLKTRLEFENEQIDSDRREIEVLEEQKNKLYQRFVDNNDKNKENFESLFELISNAATSLESLINLQDELRAAELRIIINKTQSGTKLTIYKNYLESLIDVLYDLQKKKAERELVIYNISEKYQNLNKYKKQIAEGKNIELVIDSKKEEKYKLRDDQYKISNEKAELEREISSLSSNLAVLDEKLNNYSRQMLQVRAKIMDNGIPEGVTVSEEQRVVREAIAKLKFDYETLEAKVTSSKDRLSRTRNDYDVNFSMLVSKRGDIKALEASVNGAIKDGNYDSLEELETYFISPNDLKAKQARLSDYNSELRVTEVQIRELGEDDLVDSSEEEVTSLKAEIDKLGEDVQTLSETVGKHGAEFARIEKDNKQYHRILDELKVSKHNYDLAKELSDVLRGKALAEYVAEEYLQEITVVANQKLNLLMDGRYTLKFENKEFFVEDNFNDGLVRPAGTLSGGETFLVSLSLAFAISEAISMLSSRNMEFFFLDEGFGTLDSELCEAVVSALYKLESQNLKIGLISHVAELEESIKNRVYVTKTPTGSKLKIEHSL